MTGFMPADADDLAAQEDAIPLTLNPPMAFNFKKLSEKKSM
jgi:hypothetical protein